MRVKECMQFLTVQCIICFELMGTRIDSNLCLSEVRCSILIEGGIRLKAQRMIMRAHGELVRLPREH